MPCCPRPRHRAPRWLPCLAACWWLGTLSAQTPVPADARRDGAVDVVWLHLNDFHGQFRAQEALWRERVDPNAPPQMVGGAASLAGYVARTRAAAGPRGPRVVVTDAGDWFQGTLEGNHSKGRLAVDFLSRLQVDASVIGNHEYDFGDRNLEQLLAAARFPVLGANIVVGGAAGRMPIAYARPWRVLHVAGLRIVLLGLATSDTKNVSAGPFGDAAFEREEDALRTLLPAAQKEGDVVVLLTHCGIDADRRIARAFPDIALILGGHSHTALGKPHVEGRTTIVQTQGKASSIYRLEGRVVLHEKRLDLVRSELVELDLAQHPEDEATAKWIAERTTELTAKWDRVIGELVTPLLDERGAHSTAAGNLVCDAMLAHAGAELSFSNKGGVRTRLRPGPLTLRHLYELLPFDNTLVSVGLSGAQIREMLQTNMERGKRLPDIGGGTYSYAFVDGKRVLRDVTVAGQPLADDREYRVAVSSFLADGGDAFAVFKKGNRRQEHGVLVRDALAQKAERDKKLVSDTRQRIFAADDGR